MPIRVAAAENRFQFNPSASLPLKKLKEQLIALLCLIALGSCAWYYLWGQHLYLITAYCNCPICINVPAHLDDQFASGRKIYWGGIAADRKVPFKTQVDLAPFWPGDFWAIQRILSGRTKYRVEDRGGKIKGRHIDVFIPDSMGGHSTALKWGRKWMRIRINGKLAD